jgi:hypothetical protein
MTTSQSCVHKIILVPKNNDTMIFLLKLSKALTHLNYHHVVVLKATFSFLWKIGKYMTMFLNHSKCLYPHKNSNEPYK